MCLCGRQLSSSSSVSIIAVPLSSAAVHQRIAGYARVGGVSLHVFEYMCYWTDKFSYVSNVSAPPKLQAALHIWQIT